VLGVQRLHLEVVQPPGVALDVRQQVIGDVDLAAVDQFLGELVDVGASHGGGVARLPRDRLERRDGWAASEGPQLLDLLGLVDDELGDGLGRPVGERGFG
jgi:hypothetical protein